MNRQGVFGAATNIQTFSFVVATHNLPATVYLAERRTDRTYYTPADQQWMADYAARIRAPIGEPQYD